MILKSVLSHRRHRDHQSGYIARYMQWISDKATLFMNALKSDSKLKEFFLIIKSGITGAFALTSGLASKWWTVLG